MTLLLRYVLKLDASTYYTIGDFVLLCTNYTQMMIFIFVKSNCCPTWA